MRILGIDYGTKRVGLAISDVEEKIAFPLGVMPNSPSLVRELILLIAEKEIGRIVIGESLKGDGRENALMEEVHIFVKKLIEAHPIEVAFMNESLTTIEARRVSVESRVDAQAATLILQRYLEKNS